MSIWNSFGKLATLDFVYGDIVSGVKPEIYANSRNQVEIIISVKVIDKNNKDEVLSLTPHDFYIGEDLNNNKEKASLYLCDPSTGERISSLWKLSKEKGDYAKAVNHDGHSRAKRDRSETTYIKTYLSCSENNVTKNFSIGIHIPGVGDFNTSLHGTTTLNGPQGISNSGFQAPKSLSISTLDPIDYSHASSIVIEGAWAGCGSLTVIATNIKIRDDKINWLSHVACSLPFAPCTNQEAIYTGVSSYKYMLIKSAKGHAFYTKKIEYPSYAYSLQGANIVGYAHIIWREPPSGIVGDYDVSFLFIEPDKCGLDNGSTLTPGRNGFDRKYIIENDQHVLSPTSTHHIPKRDSHSILVVICNHKMPNTSGLGIYSEELNRDMVKSCCIRVIDEYGNEGVITLGVVGNPLNGLKIN